MLVIYFCECHFLAGPLPFYTAHARVKYFRKVTSYYIVQSDWSDLQPQLAQIIVMIHSAQQYLSRH